eukprot:307896_1
MRIGWFFCLVGSIVCAYELSFLPSIPLPTPIANDWGSTAGSNDNYTKLYLFEQRVQGSIYEFDGYNYTLIDSSPYQFLFSTTIKDLIYLLTGNEIICEYNTTSLSQSYISSYKQQTGIFSACMTSNETHLFVLVFNETSAPYSLKLQVYNIEKHLWTSTPLTSWRGDLPSSSCMYYNHNLFLFGRFCQYRDDCASAENMILIYNDISGSLSLSPYRTTNYYSRGARVIMPKNDGIIYYMGGSGSNWDTYYTNVDILDADTGKVTSGGSLLQGRMWFNVGFMKGQMYVMGGCTSDCFNFNQTASTEVSTVIPTASPTETPTQSTYAPTITPTTTPTRSPSDPTSSPTEHPTSQPTTHPSRSPTNATQSPTTSPTNPTNSPTLSPTFAPTKSDIVTLRLSERKIIYAGCVIFGSFLCCCIGVTWYRKRRNLKRYFRDEG